MRCGMLFVLALCLLTSCSISSSYEAVVDLETAQWKKEQNAVFEFSPSTQVGTTSDITIFICTNTYYIGTDIRLVIKTTDPDQMFWQDTITLVTPDGKRAAATYEKLYRRSVIWPKAGAYNISVHPTDSIHGVRAVGLNVTHARGKGLM